MTAENGTCDLTKVPFLVHAGASMGGGVVAESLHCFLTETPQNDPANQHPKMPDAPQKDHPNRGFKLDRLTGFSDGVIAIAITILVLGLEVPSVHEVNESQLVDYLRDSLHPAMGYIVSFVLIGTFWLSHYVIFQYLTHATRPLIALNGLFLLCLTFLPFPTGLQAAYRHDEFAMVFYSFSLLMCGISLLGIWLYASKGHRLIDPRVSPTVVQSMTQRLAIAPALCILAIGCSFLSIALSRMILLAIPCLYISHRLVDSGWQRSESDNDGE